MEIVRHFRRSTCESAVIRKVLVRDGRYWVMTDESATQYSGYFLLVK